MDEVVFHMGRRLESIQIWLCELLEKGLELVEAGVRSEQFGRLQDLGAQATERLVEAWGQTSRWADPQLLAFKLSRLVSPDLNRATVWAGCIGFTVGGGLGLFLGVCLQSPQPAAPSMRAIAATTFDGVDGITLLEDAVVPKLYKSDQVLVQVICASIDSLDIKISQGYARNFRRHLNAYNPNVRSELPVILGRDGSGLIVEVGSQVSQFEVGDQVYFCTPPWGPGTLAEYVLLPSYLVAKKPTRIGHEGAGSIGYTGCIALHAVMQAAKISTSNAHTKRVLVHCGTAGSGWMVSQLSSSLGATVTVTCLNRAAAVMKALGAANVLPLESAQVEKDLLRSNKFDVVFNTGGEMSQGFCNTVCASDGLVVNTVQTRLASDTFGIFLGSMYALWLKITHGLLGAEEWSTASINRNRLEELRKMVDSGRIQPLVDKVYPPHRFDAALQHVDSTNAIGKTVIRFSGAMGPNRSVETTTSDRPDLLRR